jgi:hypothetical protein
LGDAAFYIGVTALGAISGAILGAILIWVLDRFASPAGAFAVDSNAPLWIIVGVMTACAFVSLVNDSRTYFTTGEVRGIRILGMVVVAVAALVYALQNEI